MNQSALQRKVLPSKFGSSPISSPKVEKWEQRQQVVVDSRWDEEDSSQRHANYSERYGNPFTLAEYKLGSRSPALSNGNLNRDVGQFLNDCELSTPFSPTSKFTSHLSNITLEDNFCESLMKERELEVDAINKKMHQVHDIYRDLAELISDQQNLIDDIDSKIEYAFENTKMGVEQIDQARLAHENPILDDPFGEKIQMRKRKNENSDKNTNTCLMFFDILQEDIRTFVHDMKSVFVSCSSPDIDADQDKSCKSSL